MVKDARKGGWGLKAIVGCVRTIISETYYVYMISSYFLTLAGF